MNQRPHQQWSEVVVKKAIGWEDGPDGGAVLLVPRFRKGPLARWLQPRLPRPFIRVKLDEIGSFVWRALDGGTPFQKVALAMKEKFGDRVEPAEVRLKTFLTILYKDKFIELLVPCSSQ
ncbi:MAG: PqqD family protein [Pseudomonadota bacterium]